MRFPPAALLRHHRFYIALAAGAAACGLAASALDVQSALLAGGDVFYLVFLLLCAPAIAGQKPADLKTRARSEDEGIAIVVLITLATMLFFIVAVFMALDGRQDGNILPLILAGIGALLGWLVLHTVMAFHYANLHYFVDPGGHEGPDLQFPGRGDPGPWDFLYFSFVIGMTAQVSDVQVKQGAMRRVVLLHGVASFFFNTVFIAMAVNAGVSLAG